MRQERSLGKQEPQETSARERATYTRVVKRRAGVLQVGAPNSYEWTTLELGVEGLPGALEGLRILHLSDLHFRARWASCYDRMIEEINGARADLILITGDFNEKKVDPGPAMPFIKRFVEQLKACVGRYGILGNHDVGLRGRDVARGAASHPSPQPSPTRGEGGRGTGETPVVREEISKLVSSLGVEMMDGRREMVPGMPVEIIGLQGGDRMDLDVGWLSRLPRKSPGLLRIVMSHYPDHLRRTALGADLFLSGHTHGGQICLPGGWPIITHDRLGRKVCKGVHRVGKTWLIVSRGVGFATIGVRVFCPPEVIEIRLRAV